VSQIEKMVNSLYAMISILLIFICICFRILHEVQESRQLFGPNSQSFFQKEASFLILFSTMLPINLYMLLDAISIMNALKIENFYENDVQDELIKINKSDTLSELGHINYLLMNNVGTLTTGECKIAALIVGDNYYEIQSKNILLDF